MSWSEKGLQKQNHETHKEEMSSRYSGGRGAKYMTDVLDAFVPREKENKIRIVEPIELDDIGWYSIEVAFHRNVGFDKSYYLCNQEMKIGPCYHTELQTGELWDTDPDQAKAYFPDRRVLMLVLDLLSDDPEKVRKWSCPATLADEIVNQCHEPETDTYKNPADPQTGAPIFFIRTGLGKHTKYSGVKVGTVPTPLTDYHANQRVRFTDLLIVPEYEEVKAAFLNSVPPDHVEEGPPLDQYPEHEYSNEAGKAAHKYEVPADTGGTVAADPIVVSAQYLTTLDRDGLKAFKVKHKERIEALKFSIYTNTADAAIAETMLEGIVEAGYAIKPNGELQMLMAIGGTPESEPVPEPEPDEPKVEPDEPKVEAEPRVEAESSAQPPAVAGSESKEKTNVKAALAAAISNRQQAK